MIDSTVDGFEPVRMVDSGRRQLLALSLLTSPGLADVVHAQVPVPAARWSVKTVRQLHEALDQANAQRTAAEIILAPGHYPVERTLTLKVSGLSLRGNPDRPREVVIQGDAMSASARIPNLIWIGAANCTVSGLRIRACRNHCIQIAGELGAHGARVSQCLIQDSFEQLVKVSALLGQPRGPACRNGVIEQCTFEYTAGIGPQFYIGGLDGHHCEHWIVRNNVFLNIASPSRRVAEQAIHFWGTEDLLVENNLIVNCDRGIQFGIGEQHSVSTGLIRNNVVWHDDHGHPFADVGISLESSSAIHVVHNTVIQRHGYPNAIEVRFARTKAGSVQNNLTNRRIRIRDGGQADIAHNREDRSMESCLARAPQALADAAPVCSGLAPVPLNAHAPLDALGRDRGKMPRINSGALA